MDLRNHRQTLSNNVDPLFGGGVWAWGGGGEGQTGAGWGRHSSTVANRIGLCQDMRDSCFASFQALQAHEP